MNTQMALKGTIYGLAKTKTDIDSVEKFKSMMVEVDSSGAVVIDGRNIAAGSIFANQLSANSITANKIKAGEITTDHITTAGISADKVKAGTLTATNGVSWLNLNDGKFSFAGGKIAWDGSTLSLTANTIRLGSSDVATTTQVNTVATNLSNLEIGGRNLVLNGNLATKSLNGWMNNGGVVYQLIDGKNIAKLNTTSGIYQYLTDAPNGMHSYSFIAKADTAGTSARIGFLNLGAGANSYFTLTTSWKKYSFTTTVPITGATDIFHVYSTGAPYYITDIKVEKGTKSTDYSSAPEDTAALIDYAQESIDGLVIGGTNLLIKHLTSNGYLISTGAQNTDVSWKTTDFIPVDAGVQYIASGYGNLGTGPSTCFYNSSKVFISGIQNSNSGGVEANDQRRLVTAPAKGYMKFSFMTSALTSTKLEKGNRPTDYTNAPEDIEKAYTDTATSKADSAQSAASSYTDNAVSIIEIGGRNYFTKEHQFVQTTANSGFYPRDPETPNGFKVTGNSSANGQVRLLNVISENGWWTVSFDIKGSQSGAAPMTVDICDLGGTRLVTNTTNTYSRVSVSVKVTNYSSSVYNFVDFGAIGWNYFWVDNIKIEKGNKATDWTEAPKDAYMRTHLPVRYIRDWENGSTANGGNHWYEIQAYSKGSNVAGSKAVSSNAVISSPSVLTDGNTSGTYTGTGSTTGLTYVQVDLGKVYYDIDEVKVWRYHTDGRTYYETKTEVSEDGTNWYPIFDSLTEGTYAEKAAGRSFEPTKANAQAITNAQKASITANASVAKSSIMQSIKDSPETVRMTGAKMYFDNDVVFDSAFFTKLFAENAMITNLDSVSIKAGQISSGLITADKIAIGDFTNYASWDKTTNSFPLKDGTLDTSTYHSAKGSIKLTPRQVAVAFKSNIEVVPGEMIYFEYWIKTDSSWNGTAGNSKFRIGDQVGAHMYSQPYHGAKTAWTKYSDSYTIPASVYLLVITLGNDGTVGNVWIDDIIIKKKTNGQLIVDGSITADHIISTGITADKIKAGRLTATNGVSWIDMNNGQFNFGGSKIVYNGSTLAINVESLQISNYPVATESQVIALDNKTGNLVNNTTLTGTISKWSGPALSVVNKDFQGNTVPVQQVYTSGDAQIFSDYFDVDPSKAYEVTMWFNQNDSGGSKYLGINDDSGGVLAVTPSGVLSSSSNSNFYFWSGANTANTWSKRTGYIMPAGTTPLDMKGIGTGVSQNAIMKPTTKKIRIRYLNYYNTGTARYIWVANPKVVEVDPNAIIAATNAKEKTDNWTYSGTTQINGSEIKTGTLSADKITTGKMTNVKGNVTLDLDGGKMTMKNSTASNTSTLTEGALDFLYTGEFFPISSRLANGYLKMTREADVHPYTTEYGLDIVMGLYENYYAPSWVRLTRSPGFGFSMQNDKKVLFNVGEADGTMAAAPVGTGKVAFDTAYDGFQFNNIVTFKPNMYMGTGPAMDLANGDIAGINSLYFNDVSSVGEGLYFLKNGATSGSTITSDYDTFFMNNGDAIWNGVRSGDVLFSGATYMNGTQSVTPTKKLNECPNGWILTWSVYSGGVAKDYDWNQTVIHKSHAARHNGNGYMAIVSQDANANNIFSKYIYVYNHVINGYASNGVAPSNISVLREVIAW